MIINIQLLRFIAALFVLLSHIILFGYEKFSFSFDWIYGYARYLNIGVDIFFIISGFIMMETIRNPKFQSLNYTSRLKTFFIKRITRIYPVWWLSCIALTPIFLIKPEWINSSAQYATSLFHSYFLIPSKGEPLNMVGWTLEYEMIFYVIFGLMLFTKTKFTAIYASITIGVLYLISTLGLLNNSPIISILGSSMMFYFPIGMALNYYYHTRIKIHLGLLLPIFCITLAYTLSYHFGSIDRLVHYGPLSTLIVLVTIELEKRQMTLFQKASLWGGNVSYALYLIHIPAISAIGKIYLYINNQDIFFFPEILAIVLMITVPLATSDIIYRFYERPIIQLFRNKIA